MAPEPIAWVDKEETRECPVPWIQDLWIVFEAYQWAQKGHLPHSGGIFEQPAVLMQCVKIVSGVVARCQKS